MKDEMWLHGLNEVERGFYDATIAAGLRYYPVQYPPVHPVFYEDNGAIIHCAPERYARLSKFGEELRQLMGGKNVSKET